MLTSPSLYVSRLVELPVSHVAQAFDLLPAVISHDSRRLVLDRQSDNRNVPYSNGPWRSVRARLRPGPLGWSFPVAVEAAPWSHDRTEVAIRPEGRKSLRHPTSFCDAAHSVIDQIAGPMLTDVLRKARPVGIVQRGRLGCVVDETDEATVVTLAGDLDQRTVGHLRDELAAPLDAGPKHVRVDLTHLRTLDEVGLAVFVHLTRTVERDRHDTSVTFAAPSDPIRRVIEDSGFAELLSVE